MRIGILGGTFNPIHNAHLRLAEEAIDQLDLDCVKLIPAAVPPHKSGVDIPPARVRWDLLRLACRDNPRLVPSPLEIHRPGPSYTIDTLSEIRAGLSTEDEIFLLIGMDCASEFGTWKDHERIPQMARIAVAMRPGYKKEEISQSLRGGVFFIEMPLMEISSSKIRSLVREGRSIRYLVPEGVRRRIQESGIYLDSVEDSCRREVCS